VKPGQSYGDLKKAEEKHIEFPQSNSFHDVERPHKAWIDTGKTRPTGEHLGGFGHGSSAVHKPVYSETTLKPGQHEVHNLHGGMFAVDKKTGVGTRMRYTDPKKDPGIFEKQYGYNYKTYKEGDLKELAPSMAAKAKYKTEYGK
jgi:hypothetical protein